MTPSFLSSCSDTITISDLLVVDVEHSDNIDWVRLEIEVNSSGCYLNLSPPSSSTNYWNVGGGLMRFEGSYGWTLTNILKSYYSPGPCGSEPSEGSPILIELRAVAKDNVFPSVTENLGSYNTVMQDACGND